MFFDARTGSAPVGRILVSMTDSTNNNAPTSAPAAAGSPNKAGRNWSPLDLLCDEYMEDVALLDPISATDWGLPGDPGGFPDLSPSGLQKRADLDASMLVALQNTDLQDDTDRVTAAALKDRLGLELELFDAGELYGDLNNIASPLQFLRDAFSLMPTATAQDWGNIVSRLGALPQALTEYKESLFKGREQGVVAARRQVQIGIDQARTLGNPDGYFAQFVSTCPEPVLAEMSAGGVSGEEILQDAVAVGAAAYADLSSWLENNLLAHAPEDDAVGRERYERFSELFVGAKVDLDETYEWGLEELSRIDAKQREIAETLYGPGVSVQEASARLEADPKYQVHGKEALLEWLQATADMAVKELNGTQFDIPKPLQTIECMIAPSQEGGIWYTAPSADFSRPGRMWWSIPEGDTVFHTWQERTTVFHEGVPGHHLQLGQAIYQADSLNLWRRLGSWNSGYGEGWALYAEELMAELGYQADPANMLGMLDAQRLRATRVVLDIGVHLKKPRPDGNGLWDAEYAWEFLRSNVSGSDGMLRFELDRYLGWPGQAPSYKIGQRLWGQLRRDYVRKHGDSEAVVRKFHDQALSLGSLPMSTLREALIG